MISFYGTSLKTLAIDTIYMLDWMVSYYDEITGECMETWNP